MASELAFFFDSFLLLYGCSSLVYVKPRVQALLPSKKIRKRGKRNHQENTSSRSNSLNRNIWAENETWPTVIFVHRIEDSEN